jgi:hypothetical protein
VEQRTYHGPITPDTLADHLVLHFDPQPGVQAQKLGSGDSLAVQIAAGDDPEQRRNALTLAIVRATNAEQGVTVTLGEQQWITPEMAGHAAVIALIGVLVTPWALFGLLWPLREAVAAYTRTDSIWSAVETYALAHGATPGGATTINHPHV